MNETETQDKLRQIEAAMKDATVSDQKLVQNLTAIIDPQDSLNCEGCQ